LDGCSRMGVANLMGLSPWAGGYPQWCGGWNPGIATFYR
jgi:hypothetical protein